jgi:putative inorganic carbon (HCO3(-)) transporter
MLLGTQTSLRRLRMSRSTTHPVPIDLTEAVTVWDYAAEWILGAMLVFMPAVLGVVSPSDRALVAIAVASIALCVLAKRVFRPEIKQVWAWAYLPIAAFILVVVVQLWALPVSLVERLSASTASTKQQLLDGLGLPADALQRFTLSFYTWGTRFDLQVVIIASTVFLAVVDVYRRPDQIKRLLTVITMIGAATALLFLLQRFSGASKIYWLVDIPVQSAAAGPFVNYNNYAQFINLSIGAALGLMFIHLRKNSVSARSFSFAGWSGWEAFGSMVMRPIWSTMAVTACGLATVVMSMSRGGTIAMLASLALMIVMMARASRLRAQSWIVFLVVLAALMIVLYVGFDAAYDRLATLQREGDSARRQIYKDVLVVFKQFPLFGTGLGSFEVTYPLFDRSTDPNVAEFADSDWAQMLMEVGVLGILAIVSFAFIIIWHYLRATRAERPREAVAAYGLGYGLLAVGIQSFTDYGQHLPAIACLSAVSCGILINLSRLSAAYRARDADVVPVVRPVRNAFSAPLRWVVPLVAVLLMVWTVKQALQRWDAASAVASVQTGAAQIVADSDPGDETFLDVLIAFQRGAELDPDNVKFAYWLNYFRWRAISRQRDPGSGALVLDQPGLANVERVVAQIRRSIPVCPSFGAMHALAGQLEWKVLGKASGRDLVRKGLLLARTDPTVWVMAGEADVEDRRWPDSVEKFRRAVDLNPAMMREVADLYVRDAKKPELAVEVALERPELVLVLAQSLKDAGTAESSAVWRSVRESVKHIKAKTLRGDETAVDFSLMASLCRLIGDQEGATVYLRRALELDYGQVEWRWELAQALAAEGKTDEAIEEARTCLRLRPTMDSARTLIGDLSIRPKKKVSH